VGEVWAGIGEQLQQPMADRKEGEWWNEIPEIFHHD
jgi:L-rhamnose mutarotase